MSAVAVSAVKVLQTILERVQLRAAEPRGGGMVAVAAPKGLVPASVPLVTAVGLQPVAPEGFSSSPIPMARRDRTITRQLQRVRVDALTQSNDFLEEIEEYDDELIELIDETEAGAGPDTAPVSSALQLDDPLDNLSEPPVSDQPIGGMALTPETVARPAPPTAAVAQAVGARPPLETTSFVELLAISLRLGS